MIPGEVDDRLAQAPWLQKEEVQKALDLLDASRGRTRVVGGVVRDTLLGRDWASSEVDMATELRPDDVLARAQKAGVPAHPTGYAHGTITLQFGSILVEVTTLRQDIETDGRHAVVRFGRDWHADAARRDFTMNALYCDARGSLFDPLGGAEDCLARRVRFIGDPDQRIAEDKLRVFRFFRFSASHGGETFESDGLAACARAAGHLDTLSAERIGAEMTRMLALPRVARTLAFMLTAGILPLDPGQVERLQAYERRAAKPSAAARLALIAQDVEALQQAWRLSNAQRDAARSVSHAAHLLGQGAISEAAFRSPDMVEAAVPLAAVLWNWSEDEEAKVLQRVASLRPAPMPVSGQDVLALGVKPGRRVGETLAALEKDWIESGFTLERSVLLARARELAH